MSFRPKRCGIGRNPVSAPPALIRGKPGSGPEGPEGPFRAAADAVATVHRDDAHSGLGSQRGVMGGVMSIIERAPILLALVVANVTTAYPRPVAERTLDATRGSGE